MPIRVLLVGALAADIEEKIAALPPALDLQIVGSSADRTGARAHLASSSADILVVSASVGDASGFDFVDAIPSHQRPPALVFVSIRDEDAVRAFELQATDFVPEPASVVRLGEAMFRARHVVLQAALLRTADELQRLIGATNSSRATLANRGGYARADMGSGVFAAATSTDVRRTISWPHDPPHDPSHATPYVSARAADRTRADIDLQRSATVMHAWGPGASVSEKSWQPSRHDFMAPQSRATIAPDSNSRGDQTDDGARAPRTMRSESQRWRNATVPVQPLVPRSRALSGALSSAEGVLDLSQSPDAVDRPQSGDQPLRVLVREGRRTRFIPLTEVDWFEADGNYILVHAADAQYRTRGTIAAIESGLDPRQFARIHRRVVVNMDRVRELSPLPGGDGLLLLGSGTTLRLSRTYRSRVR